MLLHINVSPKYNKIMLFSHPFKVGKKEKLKQNPLSPSLRNHHVCDRGG